uniref:Uncharacterized protein n=1 Tax=Cyanothece sp. (strain PCC 7425 / ATCC 29141) TaxID=395961 RepID=B8HYV7_CYAP4
MSEYLPWKSPYLLGKSIEWKLGVVRLICNQDICPYLLGKSIEWKPATGY